MSELNDFFVNVNRIADSLDRIAAAAEQIAAVHGAPQTETPQTAPKADGRKKKTPAPVEATPPQTAPAETPPPPAADPAPETEDLFGDSAPEVPAITAEDVKSVLSQALKHMVTPDGKPDTAKVSALFKQHNGGADKVSNMKPEFYKPVYDAFQSALEAL